MIELMNKVTLTPVVLLLLFPAERVSCSFCQFFYLQNRGGNACSVDFGK